MTKLRRRSQAIVQALRSRARFSLTVQGRFTPNGSMCRRNSSNFAPNEGWKSLPKLQQAIIQLSLWNPWNPWFNKKKHTTNRTHEDLLVGMAQQNESIHTCKYCNKVFDSYQALGGHLRSHQNMARRYPYFQSHHSSDGTHTTPFSNPLLMGPSMTSSGALASNYRAFRDNHIGNETGLIVPSYLSRAPNYYPSSRSVTRSGGSMPTALPLSRPMDNVNFNTPFGVAPHGGSTGSCQFDVEAVRRFINCHPSMSRNFLETMKDHNHSNHPRSCGVCSLCPCYMMNSILEHMGFIPRTGHDINKFLGVENLVFAGLIMPPPLPRSPLRGGFTVSMCPREYIRAITSGRENKRCFRQDLAEELMMIRAPKRLRVSSSSQVSWVEKPPLKELLLFKDSDKSGSGSGSEIPTGGEEKCEANLDLSLHL